MEHGAEMNGGMAMAPSSEPSTHRMHKMMMHMTLFWGKDVEILFDGWPGRSLGMYLLSLVLVFLVSLLVEWLSFCRWARPTAPSAAAGLLQTFLYTLRVGLAYLVMLAVMSFNAGVLLVAVTGHAVGFLLFGSSLFKRHQENDEKQVNGCPRNC